MTQEMPDVIILPTIIITPNDPVLQRINHLLRCARANRDTAVRRPGYWDNLTPDYWRGKINGLGEALRLLKKYGK